jgi:T-complex protein 1 subunit eta
LNFILKKSYFSNREQRALLEKCAQTTLSSKLIARQREFFAKMVVDAVLMLDELLPLNMYV